MSYRITVVIPTVETHHGYIQQAINSIDFKSEVIVVNDSIKPLKGNVTIVNRETEPKWGAGRARNIGATKATGECLVFLDADDMMYPGALQKMWNQYLKTGHIVYGNVQIVGNPKTTKLKARPQYCGEDIRESSLVKPNRSHCCHLTPKAYHDFIGGFNESLETWEDILYEIDLDMYFHADYLDTTIFIYRWNSGLRRKLSEGENNQARETARSIIYNKWKDYYEGRKKLDCSLRR